MRFGLLGIGVPILALAAPAPGQVHVERFERQLEQIQRETRMLVNAAIPPEQRAFFDYGAYLGLNFFSIDDVEQHNHLISQYDLVAYARLNLDNIHEFFLRGRTSYRHFIHGGAFQESGDEGLDFTLEQASYRFDLARYLNARGKAPTDNNLVFQGGRQFVYWANGLVLAQYLDGAILDLKLGDTSVALLGGVTIDDTIDFDTSRPDYDDQTSRGFYGAMLSQRIGRHRPFVYALAQRDYNDHDRRIDHITDPPIVTRYHYDSYYIGAGSNGSLGDRVLYAIEAVYEGGEGLSSSVDALGAPLDQEFRDISAWAVDARLDYLVGDPKRTRLSAEGILASGDDDRLTTNTAFQGNLSGHDTAFNAWGLLNTGLAFAPPVSNVAVLRLGASTYPFESAGSLRRLQVGTDLFLFAKTDMDAPIDEQTTNERLLGVEPDFYLNWQMTSDVTLALRYGIFLPGSAIIANDRPRHFVFVGMTFSF